MSRDFINKRTNRIYNVWFEFNHSPDIWMHFKDRKSLVQAQKDQRFLLDDTDWCDNAIIMCGDITWKIYGEPSHD